MKRHSVSFGVVVLATVAATLPLRAAAIETFILSNEGSNGLVSQLVAHGYGSMNLYQTLQSLASNTSPAASSSIPAAFLALLGTLPSTDAIFTTQLQNVNPGTQAIAISSDGTVQIVSIFGATYTGTAGTSTLVSSISGVGNADFISPTSPGGDITSFVANSFPYDVIGIAFAPSSPGPTPAPSALWLVLIGFLAVLAYAMLRWRKPVGA